jgi:hypothetical protein
MRELINLIQNISEGVVGLSAGEINKYDWRFKKFIEYIDIDKPFTTIDGEEVVLHPDEAERFQQMYDDGTFKGNLKAVRADGGEIALSKIAKTGDFGGAAVAAGQAADTGGKEGLLVKPSQIGICDQNIPASEFYDMIVSNTVLNRTDYGKVVIQLAEYITAGEYVMLPQEYQGKEKEKVRKAIIDYAGEYLGVLALLYGRSRFPRRASFEEWMGGSVGDLTLFFPSKANTNLADSYAQISNPTTSHNINISSKGTGGGAAPAISGLKVPPNIENDPNFAAAVEFIKICRDQGTIPQSFSAMDLIYKTNPQALSKKWHKFLPFATKNPELEGAAKRSIDAKKQRQDYPLPNKFAPLYSDITASASASDGGKLIYAIKKEVADAVNNRDAIPGFKDAILQILEMNFIQQYTDYKGGQITFATQWPAKLDGNISVENKSSAVDPTAGGFSFKLGRTDDSVSSEPGVDPIDGSDSEEDFVDMSAQIAGGASGKTSKSSKISSAKANATVGDVGRKKRK